MTLLLHRCCEKTMEVMHNHQEALLTILEVLLYDPLNNWTISPQKAAALQGRRDRMDTETSELNVTMDIDNANTSAQGGSTFSEIIVTTSRVNYIKENWDGGITSKC